MRARIVLGGAAGETNRAVARKLSITPQPVCKWWAQFIEGRLDALLGEPRPGAPLTISGAQVAR